MKNYEVKMKVTFRVDEEGLKKRDEDIFYDIYKKNFTVPILFTHTKNLIKKEFEISDVPEVVIDCELLE